MLMYYKKQQHKKGILRRLHSAGAASNMYYHDAPRDKVGGTHMTHRHYYCYISETKTIVVVTALPATAES